MLPKTTQFRDYLTQVYICTKMGKVKKARAHLLSSVKDATQSRGTKDMVAQSVTASKCRPSSAIFFPLTLGKFSLDHLIAPKERINKRHFTTVLVT